MCSQSISDLNSCIEIPNRASFQLIRKTYAAVKCDQEEGHGGNLQDLEEQNRVPAQQLDGPIAGGKVTASHYFSQTD